MKLNSMLYVKSIRQLFQHFKQATVLEFRDIYTMQHHCTTELKKQKS